MSDPEKNSSLHPIIINSLGLHGTIKPTNKKGICAICSRFEEVGMFMSETKGTVQGTFIKKGNYICLDSMKCNQNITTLDKMNDFIERLNK